MSRILNTRALHGRVPFVLTGAVIIAQMLSLALTLRYSAPVLLFVPFLLLAIPILGTRLLTNPVPVISLFLIAIVNLDFFKLGDTAISMDILISASLMWALILRSGLQSRFPAETGLERAYLIFLAVTLISVVLSVNLAISVKNWIRSLEYLLLIGFIFSMNLSTSNRRQIAGAIVLSSLIPCLLGLAGMALHIDALYGQETPVGGGEMVKRIQSTLSHPNTLGYYCALVSIFTLGLMMDRRWFRGIYLLPILLIQLSVLYMTFGRTGWVEFVIGAATLLLLRGQRWLLLISIPIATVGLAVFLPGFFSRWETALLSSHDNSFLWRIGLWIYSLQLFPVKPIFGSGPDTFREYVSYSTGFNAHMTWMRLLIETGIVGVTAFLALMMVVVGKLLRQFRVFGNQDPLLMPVMAMWAATLVGSLAGDPFALPSGTVYLWVLTALVTAPRMQRS